VAQIETIMKNYFFLMIACIVTACTQPTHQFSFSVCGKLPEYPAVIKAGYDCMELIVGDFFVPGESDSVFMENLKMMKRLDAKIISCMQFIPAYLKMTGPEARHDEIMVWTETTFRRSQMAGIPYIVLGSGDARNVPDGFDRQVATQQIIDLCKRMAPIAQKYGIILLVEPLAKRYSNFIHTLAEGAAIVKAVNHPNVQLLCDIHHMLLEDDPAEEILKYGEYIRHCHIAEKTYRTAPGTLRDDFRPYFQALKKINYQGCISVEIDYVNGKYQWDDFEKQIASALQYMKQSIN
jgi:sugar phosphate isomerase/epimerase